MRTDGMLKDDALKGQTIIVTGGGTGLGKSMGKYFLEVGANLVITSRKIDVLENVRVMTDALVIVKTSHHFVEHILKEHPMVLLTKKT